MVVWRESTATVTTASASMGLVRMERATRAARDTDSQFRIIFVFSKKKPFKSAQSYVFVSHLGEVSYRDVLPNLVTQTRKSQSPEIFCYLQCRLLDRNWHISVRWVKFGCISSIIIWPVRIFGNGINLHIFVWVSSDICMPCIGINPLLLLVLVLIEVFRFVSRNIEHEYQALHSMWIDKEGYYMWSYFSLNFHIQ